MSATARITSTYTTPMSGVFTPPSSCSSHWTYEAQSANSVVGGLLLQNAAAGQGDQPCFPPGFDGFGRAPSYIQIFSPGVCPSGYTTANNNYNGGTTTAVCCLSKFGYTNFISSVNAGGITAQYFGCTSIFTDAGITTVFEKGNTGTLTSSLDGTTTIFTTVSGLITMWAQPITVGFQRHDLSLFTTTTTTTPHSRTSSTTSTTASESFPTNSSSDSPTPASSTLIMSPTQTQTPSPGPSGGAIAGIVVGAVAVVAIIIGASLLFRKQRKGTPPASQGTQMAAAGHPEQYWGTGNTNPDPAHPKTSYDISSHEKPAELQDAFAELPTKSPRHELP